MVILMSVEKLLELFRNRSPQSVISILAAPHEVHETAPDPSPAI